MNDLISIVNKLIKFQVDVSNGDLKVAGFNMGKAT